MKPHRIASHHLPQGQWQFLFQGEQWMMMGSLKTILHVEKTTTKITVSVAIHNKHLWGNSLLCQTMEKLKGRWEAACLLATVNGRPGALTLEERWRGWRGHVQKDGSRLTALWAKYCSSAQRRRDNVPSTLQRRNGDQLQQRAQGKCVGNWRATATITKSTEKQGTWNKVAWLCYLPPSAVEVTEHLGFSVQKERNARVCLYLSIYHLSICLSICQSQYFFCCSGETKQLPMEVSQKPWVFCIP